MCTNPPPTQLAPNNSLPPSPSPKILLILSILLPSPITSTYPTIFLTFFCPTNTMSQPIVPLMPTCGDCVAPQFNPTKPHKLCQFFKGLKLQYTQSYVVDEEEMKGHALWFVDCNTMELWEILPEFTNMTTDELCSSGTAVYPFIFAFLSLSLHPDVLLVWITYVS